jgi:hypothetical protein
MPTNISTYANEKGTYIITVNFYDEDDVAVTPNSLTWTLSDVDGNVINSREDVVVNTPSSTEEIVLTGEDLAIQEGETDEIVLRKFTVEAAYDSDAGSNLPLKDEATFGLNNLTGVS